jgi:hypothetical protein
LADRKRDPALFNLAIDSKRLGWDVIALKAEDISAVQNVVPGPLRHFAAAQQTVAFRGIATPTPATLHTGGGSRRG